MHIYMYIIKISFANAVFDMPLNMSYSFSSLPSSNFCMLITPLYACMLSFEHLFRIIPYKAHVHIP